MFDSGVLCFLPKFAVNGAIFVVGFGNFFVSWMISAILSARVIFDHFGSLSSTDSRRFFVCIRRSIMLVALWSPAGVNNSFMLLLLQKISNSLDLCLVAPYSSRYTVKFYILFQVCYHCVCVAVLVYFSFWIP